MGANGLIVAFVVAVWAAYFVPLVLRRYDEASSSESLESLSPLSRVVSRRREAAQPEEVDSVDEIVDEPVVPAESDRPAAPQSASSAPTRRAAIVAARRRRRTLLTLLTSLVLVGGLAAFSVVSPVWVGLPALLVVAWLVACRVQVRAERGISSPRRERASLASRLPSLKRAAQSAASDVATRSSRRAAPERTVDDEHTIVVSGQFEDVEPDRKHVMQRTELPADALEEKLQIAVPSVSTSGTPLWDPLPVTLPTYVTKPRVGRTVRTIDFDAPGTWTSGHVEGEDVELPGGRTAGETVAEQPRRASGQ
ncbi:divisome protein SepX/GlpR [Aeromicrobium sp.]|uniref:divisome protein SepX/GlpR n=1 Tax=Aeromicrobium sp. TaxID=1871063 RepID=UPI004033AFAE